MSSRIPLVYEAHGAPATHCTGALNQERHALRVNPAAATDRRWSAEPFGVTREVRIVPLRQFERSRFFTGQVLTADDLQREQDYHRDKARLHNRFLHGWGVVAGLRVSVDQGAVVVAPGLALDCAGNELILPTEERVSLSGLTGRQYVTIRYVELPTAQIPSPSGEVEVSRIKEAVVLRVLSTNPQAGHSALPSGGPGCGQSHELCLASISQRSSRWRVTPVKVRRKQKGRPRLGL